MLSVPTSLSHEFLQKARRFRNPTALPFDSPIKTGPRDVAVKNVWLRNEIQKQVITDAIVHSAGFLDKEEHKKGAQHFSANSVLMSKTAEVAKGPVTYFASNVLKQPDVLSHMRRWAVS
jgi:hypothetical protein